MAACVRLGGRYPSTWTSAFAITTSLRPLSTFSEGRCVSAQTHPRLPTARRQSAASAQSVQNRRSRCLGQGRRRSRPRLSAAQKHRRAAPSKAVRQVDEALSCYVARREKRRCRPKRSRRPAAPGGLPTEMPNVVQAEAASTTASARTPGARRGRWAVELATLDSEAAAALSLYDRARAAAARSASRLEEQREVLMIARSASTDWRPTARRRNWRRKWRSRCSLLHRWSCAAERPAAAACWRQSSRVTQAGEEASTRSIAKAARCSRR